MIFNLFKLIILWIFSWFSKEHFVFKEYSDETIGYCHPNLSIKEFKTGNYSTCCWNHHTVEDCNLINKVGKYCGKNLNTGKNIPCIHSLGSCKDNGMCAQTCFPKNGLCNQSYMIKVEKDNMISTST